MPTVAEHMEMIRRIIDDNPEKKNLEPELTMLITLNSVSALKGMDYEMPDDELDSEVKKHDQGGVITDYLKGKTPEQMRELAKDPDALSADFKKQQNIKKNPDLNEQLERMNRIDRNAEIDRERKKKKQEEELEEKQNEIKAELDDYVFPFRENIELGDGPVNVIKVDQADPEAGTDYVLNSYGKNYLEASAYTETIKSFGGTLDGLDYDTAKTAVLQTAALVINARLCKMSGKKPDVREFNNTVVDMMNSKAFKKTVEDMGGDGIDGLVKMQQSLIADDGRDLFGKFMQNAEHISKQEQQFKKIREDAVLQRNSELGKNDQMQLSMNNK